VQPELFGLLGLKRKYFLDLVDLDHAWRELSRQVHPDRFARRSAVERRMSLQWTAHINEARRGLRDPVQRARYLASGRLIAKEEGGPSLDPEFLETIFELQMEAASDPEGTQKQAKAMQQQQQSSLEQIFVAWEAGSGALDAVEEHLARLKYLSNIVQENT